MCRAQRDVYLSTLLYLGYIGVFILLCIILIIRRKRDNSQRQRHGSGFHLHLVRSLGNINNSMLQMEMEHRRSMSHLMDRVAGLEEHLKSGDGSRRQRYENQSQRHCREHRETPSRSSQVSPDNTSRNYFKVTEGKDRGLSQENKKLQAVINSLRRQNDELTERLEDITETVALHKEVKNSKDLEAEHLEERLYAIEMCRSEHLDVAEDLNIEMFKAVYANEDITEDNADLHQQLSATKQDTENVAKHLQEFRDAVGATKASLLRDRQLSDPLSTELLAMMEQLLSETRGFMTPVNRRHEKPLESSPPRRLRFREPSPSP